MQQGTLQLAFLGLSVTLAGIPAWAMGVGGILVAIGIFILIVCLGIYLFSAPDRGGK